MSTKDLSLGEFKTLGEISKIFLNSLGVTVNKTFDRLCVENKADLEIIQNEIELYLNDLQLSKGHSKLILFEDNRYKLNSNLVNFLKTSFFEFYYCYTDIIHETTIFTTQENLNKKMEESFFIPYIDTLMRKMYYLYKDYLYINKLEEIDYYNQTKETILKKIGKESFTFLINKSNDPIGYYDTKDYTLILSIENNFHSDNTLNDLIDSILSKEEVSSKLVRENLELSFFFSRMHQEFIKGINGSKEIKKRKLSMMNESLVMKALNDLSKVDEKFNKEIIKLDSLKRKVDLYSKKSESDSEEFLKEYESIESSEINFKWVLKHIKGRYLVMNNEYKNALNCYKEALELGKYRAGKLLNKIIKEGVVLSAYLGKKKSFEKFYKRAYIYNLVDSQLRNEDEWIMDHYRKDFTSMFPESGFYKKSVKTKKKQDFYTLNRNSTPKLNLKRPNSKHDLWDRKRSQLEIFSSLSAFDIETEKKYQEYMRQLIDAGADVNFVNSTGETPLIGALCSINYERALILLKNKEIKNSVNQISNRKKNTALSVFLENLDIESDKAIEILEKLIENGVDLNKVATADDVTPLHQIMSYFVKRIPISKREFENINIDGLRRVMHTPGVIDCYFDKDVITNMKNLDSPEGKEILNFMNNANEKKKNLYLKIVEILLNNGSDINTPWKNEITPFMYSLEIGDMDLFKLLLNYNPDITKRCHLGNDVLAISSGYNNFEIFKHLIDFYDFSNYDVKSFTRLFETTFLLNYDEKVDYEVALKYLSEFINKSKLSPYDKIDIKNRFSKKLNRMR